MNGLGLAGAELHGMIGYNVLARYRMEIDFTQDKMIWTPLDFEPPAAAGAGRRADGAGPGDDGQAHEDGRAACWAKRPKPEIVARGFLGIELADGDEGIVVKAVLANGPAATAGLKPGDHIVTRSRARQ